MDKAIIMAQELKLYYGNFQALKGISLAIPGKTVTALIGPSGCGKSSFLRSINRMNDTIAGARVEGQMFVDGRDVYTPETDVVALRKRVGMLFQRPNPFPMSIYDNVAYGPRIHGEKSKQRLDGIVERSLVQAALWEEVKDRLSDSALGMSGGQQQRLCLARVLAVDPEVILMDEPASALDPVSTTKIEELMDELKGRYTIVIVTHNMQQAARVSSWTAFFLDGQLIEYAETSQIFTMPRNKRTEDYITGRFG